MPLEAVMICVDNSDYTRNGDYAPTRFDEEINAVNLVGGAKTQQNPENSVGVLSTAGDRVEINLTPTSDPGRIIAEISKIKIQGMARLMRGIQTAQLALKHRQNKNQKQRIIAFIGSPITETEKELETLGKLLKKNNVSIDLVSFGEVEENNAKLTKLLNAANSSDTSHLLEIGVGPKLLSDVLLSSPVITPEGEAPIPGSSGEGFSLGVDPNEDPELALALRMSMEEERLRQQQSQPAAAEGPATATEPSGQKADEPAAEPGATPAPVAEMSEPVAVPETSDVAAAQLMEGFDDMEEMDPELKAALLLSLQDNNDDPPIAPVTVAPATLAPGDAPAAAPQTEVATTQSESQEPRDMEGDTEMKDAVEEVFAAQAPEGPPPQAQEGALSEEDLSEQMKICQDEGFLRELLGSLPGVNVNDPRIQEVLKEVSGKDGEPKPDDKDDEKKEPDGDGES